MQDEPTGHARFEPNKKCFYCTADCSPRASTQTVMCENCRAIVKFNAWADRNDIDLTTIDDDYHLRLMTSKAARITVMKRTARKRKLLAV